eukprot:5756530-Amphidinium_carterae.1
MLCVLVAGNLKVDRDLERRALVAMPARVNIVWMKAHQTDRDAQGNRLADTAANNRTRTHVPFEPFEPFEEWQHWGTVCQAVRHFWLLVGPKMRIRPEQWPRVRLPPLNLSRAEVARSWRPISLNNFNNHALRGRACRPLQRKKRAKLELCAASALSAAAGLESQPVGVS